MSRKNREQRLRDWRSVRAGAIAGLIPSLIFTPLDIFVLSVPLVAFAQGLLLLASLTTIVLATRKMHRLSVSRTDWPSVYRMERAIWGRTFEHQGAPGEGASVERRAEALSIVCELSRQAEQRSRACAGCGFGTAAFRGDLCAKCSLRAQRTGRQP